MTMVPPNKGPIHKQSAVVSELSTLSHTCFLIIWTQTRSLWLGIIVTVVIPEVKKKKKEPFIQSGWLRTQQSILFKVR